MPYITTNDLDDDDNNNNNGCDLGGLLPTGNLG